MTTCRSDAFLTDGGLEITLIFHEGLDMPDFASFALLTDPETRSVWLEPANPRQIADRPENGSTMAAAF